jgi:UDP:flavonoid glycosyltransferase YjiC (YdhE family)
MTGATVLFLPYPSASGTWGSVMKLLAVAHECRARGDRAIFHACPPVAEHVASRGFETITFSGAKPKDLASPIDSFYDAYTALGFDDRNFWETLIQSEEEVIERLRPDVMVTHMRPSATISAMRHGIPVASFASWCTDPRSLPEGDYPLDATARELAWRWAGLRVTTMAELVSYRADLQWATSFPLFEPELAGTPGLSYTGHLGPPRDSGTSSTPPVPDRLVLVYTSSAPWNLPGVYRALDHAAALADATVWCVTKAAGLEDSLSWRVNLYAYLPFERLLPQASALIFHGGQSTALASLEHCLPSLVLPGRHYERRYNAARLAELGSGIHGELADLRPSRIANILQRLLHDGGMREAARQVRDQATGYGGTAAAVDSLHELLAGAGRRQG